VTEQRQACSRNKVLHCGDWGARVRLATVDMTKRWPIGQLQRASAKKKAKRKIE
jgi:hypothetical protein